MHDTFDGELQCVNCGHRHRDAWVWSYIFDGGDLSRFRVGDEVPACDIMYSAEGYFRLGAQMRGGVDGISILEPWDCGSCRTENAVRIEFAEGRVSRIEAIIPSAAELASIDLFSFSFEEKELFVREVTRQYPNVDESRVRALSQPALVEAIVDEEYGRYSLDLDDADEDD